MSTTVETAVPVVKNEESVVSLEAYDEEQVRLMEERCILVTPDDVAYGEDSKKTCHLMSNISQGLLHRAFSVFLFRPSDGRLLLQQRAAEKITFPNMWTNTCCSHPLSIKGELEETNEIGVKRAALRKLPHELGIPPSQLKTDDFTYLTRIHYLAPSLDGELWGEHEVDYILFCTLDVTVDLNPNECSDARYVSEEELKEMFADSKNSFTPWFRLICRDLLFPWWSKMIKLSKEKNGAEGKIEAAVLAGDREEKVRSMI